MVHPGGTLGRALQRLSGNIPSECLQLNVNIEVKVSYFVHEEVYDNRHRPEVAALGEARPAWLWVQHGDAPPRPLEDKDVLDQEHASTHVAVLNALLNHESNASSEFCRPLLKGQFVVHHVRRMVRKQASSGRTIQVLYATCLGWTRNTTFHAP